MGWKKKLYIGYQFDGYPQKDLPVDMPTPRIGETVSADFKGATVSGQVYRVHHFYSESFDKVLIKITVESNA